MENNPIYVLALVIFIVGSGVGLAELFWWFSNRDTEYRPKKTPSELRNESYLKPHPIHPKHIWHFWF